jgi:hypothetical protein
MSATVEERVKSCDCGAMVSVTLADWHNGCPYCGGSL